MTSRLVHIDATQGPALRSVFLASAAVAPDAIALTIGERTWAYRELEHAARAWAGAMIEALGRPPERVGILASRSWTGYAGTLAALCAGAAFVPLNPAFPLSRSRAMLAAADVDAIITDKAARAQLEPLLEGIETRPLILLPEAGTEPAPVPKDRQLDAAALAGAPALAILPPVLPEAIAYLLFTSGSTGKPKGVPVTNANVLHFLDAVTHRYDFSAQDRFSQTFDQTFDLSVFDLFVAWAAGACVCVPQPIELLAPQVFVQKRKISVWFSVPSVPVLMRKKALLTPGSMPSLRWSLFCGEPLPADIAAGWQAAAPHSILENLYGPTEVTIACCGYRWNEDRSPAECVDGIVPIGRPFAGLGAVVLGEGLNPVEDGAPGELCLCGPQTVPGYWHDTARTADSFVTLPAGRSVTARFYRTGDRVRRRSDGNYVYLGRVDYQIKVLGHRVELGEVEAVLRADSRVAHAVALGWPVESGSAKGIVAFVSGNALDTDSLLERSRKQLPDYMVPRQIVTLDEMPLNANGKVDRGALLELLRTSSAQ